MCLFPVTPTNQIYLNGLLSDLLPLSKTRDFRTGEILLTTLPATVSHVSKLNHEWSYGDCSKPHTVPLWLNLSPDGLHPPILPMIVSDISGSSQISIEL